MFCFKPLSYASLKTVIFHMDPNLRILLSWKVRNFQITERSVPLKIENFTLKSDSISINEMKYEVRIGKFEFGENQKLSNFIGFSDSDMDEYGFLLRDDSNFEIFSGDILINTQELHDNQETTENEHLEAFARFQEKVLTRDSGYFRSIEKFKNYKEKVENFELKRQNLEPKFKMFVCLKIENFGMKSTHYEFLEYDRKIHYARKYLNLKILDFRDPILVRNLKISARKSLRLPANSKFQVQNLSFEYDYEFSLEIFRPILILPIKTMEIQKFKPEDVEILSSAEKLIIKDVPFDFSTIANFRRVHFSPNYFFKESLFALIRHWQESLPKIGTFCSFEIERYDAREIGEFLEKQGGAQVKRKFGLRFSLYPNTTVFPINNWSEISISFTEDSSLTSKGNCRIDVQVQEKGEYCKPIGFQNFPRKIISENAWKAVILNMDPGLRILLAQKIPEFAVLEKKVPLKIEFLKITTSEIEINKTSLSFEVITVDNNSPFFGNQSFETEFFHDVDEYGIRIPPKFFPGNLNFGLFEMDEETEKAHLDLELIDLEIKYQLEDEYGKHILKHLIGRNRWKADRFRLKDEKISPNFEFFIRFLLRNETFRTERNLRYSQNIDSFTQNLMENIFGNRKNPIFVKNLALKAEGNFLRIPVDFKLNVENLSISNNRNSLKILNPILSSGFENLKSIGIDNIKKEDMEILKEIEEVVITENFFNGEENMEDISFWDFKSVKFVCYSLELLVNIVRDLHIGVTVLEPGAGFVFGCHSMENEELIENIERVEGSELGEFRETRFSPPTTCVIVPINDELEVNIFLPAKAPRKFFGMDGIYHVVHENRYSDGIELRIRPKGFASRLNL